MGFILFLTAISCRQWHADSCVELPYQGRHLFSPGFESARAALLAYAPSAERTAASRVGGMSEGWEVRLVIADDPVGQPDLPGRTTRRDECGVLEIRIPAGELAAGSGERTQAILVHEFVHAIVLSEIDADAMNVPVWVMEGLAVWGADQVQSKARALLEKYLHKPSKLPLVELWSPPPPGAEFPRDGDYFMSGVLVSVALPDRGAAVDFLGLLSEGVGWTSALEKVSGRSFDQLLSAAREQGAAILERERQLGRFDEFADAMSSNDQAQLDWLAESPDYAPFRAEALLDLQSLVCDGSELARCRDLSLQVRQSASGLSIPALARAELNLGRALLRAGQAKECTEVVWSALHRTATAIPADRLASALELLADCHASGSDLRGFIHVAKVASDVLAGTPEYPQLMERLERRARERDALPEFWAVWTDRPVAENSDGTAQP
jgi:hypothetical protein